METSDLWRIFKWTAITALLITVSALPQSSLWASDYAIWSAIANLNWLALALIFTGLAEKGALLKIVAGGLLKINALAALMVVAWLRGVEISSFLVAIHTFLAVALVYSVWFQWRGKDSAPPIPTETGL